MKIEVIRTYDIGAFKNKIEELYQTKDVDHVDTHTETMPRTVNSELIWFVAIVFYKEKDEVK